MTARKGFHVSFQTRSCGSRNTWLSGDIYAAYALGNEEVFMGWGACACVVRSGLLSSGFLTLWHYTFYAKSILSNQLVC